MTERPAILPPVAGRTFVRGSLTIAASLAVFLAGASPSAAAQTCAARKITATGAPSNLAFFARSRARTAWIAKVTREPRLGATYGQWLRARERRVVCRKLDTQQICIAVALPCRSLSAAATIPPNLGRIPQRPL